MNVGIKLSLLLAFAPVGLGAQSFLEQFSYDGLRFSGIGIEGGRVFSDRLSPSWSPGVRVDYGLLAPRVRLVIGMMYSKGQLNPAEVGEFEASLRRIVNDPTRDATITVGQIDWGSLEGYTDLHYLLPSRGRVLGYLGLGLGVQLWNGSGTAIDGTFVEDALDTIVAGANGVLGAEFAVSGRLRFTLEARGGLTSELRTVSTRAGLLYRLPSAGGN